MMERHRLEGTTIRTIGELCDRPLRPINKRKRTMGSRSQSLQGQQTRAKILEFVAACAYGCTYRELCTATGRSSVSTVHHHVQVLRESGALAPADPNKIRHIMLAAGTSMNPLVQALELARKIDDETPSNDTAMLVLHLEREVSLRRLGVTA